ncbi:MAG: hypothetical protein AAFR12_13100 [Cyanobacteria bacterium J06626_6]
MTFLLIRRTFGIFWFAALVVLTALIIIVMDANAESISSALKLPYLSSIAMLSLPITLVAMPSFLFFRKKRWMLGTWAAVITSLFSWALLQALQTTLIALSPTEIAVLFPKVVAVLGGWTILISLPPALLLDR